MKKFSLIIAILFCNVLINSNLFSQSVGSPFEKDNLYYFVLTDDEENPTVSVRRLQYGTYVGTLNIPSTVTYTWFEGTQDEKEVTYTVTTIQRDAFKDCSNISAINFPPTVTTIGQQAFANTGLTNTLTIPPTITSIGDSAFINCTGLTTVIINMTGALTNKSYLLFSGCTNVTYVEIGENVTGYGYSSDFPIFQYCTNIETLVLKKGVGVGPYASGRALLGNSNHGMKNLKTVTIESGVVPTYLCYGAKNLTTVNIYEGVTLIQSGAFRDCSSLTSVTIPNTVTTIETQAFNQSGLSSLTIPSSVVEIGNNAFRATKIATLNIPSNVINVGDYCFYNCTSLTEAIINNSGNVGNACFSGCNALEKVDIKNTVKNIGNECFENCTALTDLTINNTGSIGYEAFNNCNKLVGPITIPNTVTNIGREAFYNCKLLESITLNNQGSLGYSMFVNCTNLQTVNIGTGVTAIGYSCFRNCSNIEGTITIPTTVTDIGYNAFENLNKVTAIVFDNPSATVPALSIGNSAFISCSSLTEITLPCRTATWQPSAFDNCTNLEAINICENDPNYSSDDGVIYNADKTKVIKCPAKKSGHYTILSTAEEIGDNAFASCSLLTSVTIPSSVTTIGRKAFAGSGLTNELIVPSTVTVCGDSAFASCTGLTSAVINLSGALPSAMFSGCTNLQSVELGPNLTSYPTSGTVVFYDCTALETVIVKKGLDQKANYLFRYSTYATLKNVTIESGVVPEHMFLSQIKLVNITIQDGVTAIRTDAFYNCNILESASLPNTITSIGNSAFHSCKKLATINMPTNLQTIGDRAFYECQALAGDLVLPSGVTDVGRNAFYNTILESATTYGNLDYWVFQSCKKLKSVNINNGSIGQECFKQCSSLETVTLNGVTTIGLKAFQNLKTVKGTITIPSTVTNINDNAFDGLTNLEYLVFEEADSPQLTIGNLAFANDSTIKSVTLPCRTISWQTNAFNNCSSLEELNLCENDPNYSSHQGVIYNGDKTKVIFCPPAKSGHYDILTSAQEIDKNAFSYCTKLTSVNIPPSVTTIGDSAFLGSGLANELTIPSTVLTCGVYAFAQCLGLTHVVVDMSGSIPSYLFQGCTNIVSAEIGVHPTAYPPSSNAPNYAFRTCSNLKTVVMKKGLDTYAGKLFESNITDVTVESGVVPTQVFSSQRQLVSATINEGVTKICGSAFSQTVKLTSIDIPSTVTVIGSSAFSNSGLVGELNLPQGLVTIGSSAFSNCKGLTGTLNLPASLDSIYSSAFSGCTGLTGDLVIPDNVRYMKGDSEFSDCKGLTSVTIPNSIEQLGSSTFKNCTGLTTANINCKKLGQRDFSGCTNLTNLNISNDVTYIDFYCFENCKSLETVTIPQTVTNLGAYAFDGCNNLIEATTNGAVGQYAFRNCTELTTVNIESGSIGNYVFNGCNKLTTANINTSVTSIGTNAFANNTSLTTLVFEEGYASSTPLNIGTSAFAGCTGLTEIYNYNLIPPTVNVLTQPFGTMNTSGITMYVSCLSLDAYKKSHWSGLIGEDQMQSRGNEEKIEKVYDHMVIPIAKANCKTVLRKNIQIMPESSIVFLGLSWSVEPDNELQQNIIDSNTTFTLDKKLKIDQWNLIANQFTGDNTYNVFNNNYGNLSELTHDMAVLPFDYQTNNWTSNWNKLTDERPSSAKESLFAWPFGEWVVQKNDDGTIKTNANGEPITKKTNPNDEYVVLPMTITDVMEQYKEKDIDLGHTNNGSLTTGGRWFAFSNPYAGRLRATNFLGYNGSSETGHTKIQGGVIYQFDAENNVWNTIAYDGSEEATIQPGEGFMVASVNDAKNLELGFALKNIYYPDQTSKAVKEKGIVFTSNTNGTLSRAKAIMNEYSSNGFDSHDAYIMIATNNTQVAEPYFIVENRKLINNNFQTLPYECPIGFHAGKYSRVEFGVENVPEDIEVTLIDKKAANKQTVISDGTKYSFNVVEGDNIGRFVVKFSKKNIGINETANTENDIRININNNEIFVNGVDLHNLQVINTLGQVVMEQKLNGNNYQTTLDLPSGAYIIKVITTNNTKTEKIVIK